MAKGFSAAAIKYWEDGPFPNRVDPWAEGAHYFRAIHNETISSLLAITRQPLFALGYVAGRETSLQIAEGREPDINITHLESEKFQRWNYELAAAEVLAEPGVRVVDEVDLQAIHIREMETGNLVTVVEVVSPGNKTRPNEITAYQERRTRLYLERGVNVVEIDLTRSVKRLTNNSETTDYPYHVAVFLPAEAVYVVGITFDQPLSRIALPLRGNVIPIELHEAYAQAYRQTNTAWHIHHDKRYTEADLSFPTLLSEEQRREVLEQVRVWQERLVE